MQLKKGSVSRWGAALLLGVCTCLLVPADGPIRNVRASLESVGGGLDSASNIPLDLISDSVGATAAEFRVDESGAATYSVPLYAVPGTAGVAPSISLNYSSQAGNGPLGKGWSIGGLSSISRCRATREAGDFISGGIPHDGVPRPILFDGNDRFCLDGQRLLEVANTPACASAGNLTAVQLRTEIESFQRVCAYTPTGGSSGPAFFTVERKDGSISWYGDRSTNAGPDRPDGYVNATAPGKTDVAIAWAQTRFQDSTGNYIDFVYHENPNGIVGEHLLGEVRFTGKRNLEGQSGPELAPYAKLAFHYELLSDPYREKGYLAGGAMTRAHRLAAVVSCATIACPLQEQVRHYQLTYAGSPSGSGLDVLVSLRECRDSNKSVCLTPTTFAWSGAKYDFATHETPTGLPAVGSAFRGYKLADIDGDGRQDLVYLREGNVNCATDWLVVGFAKLDGAGRPTYEFAAPRCLPARIRDRGDGAWHLFDYDGDGRDDLMVSGAPGAIWHLYASVGRSGNGFSSNNLLVSDPIWSHADAKDQVQVADLNGDGLTDVVYPAGNGPLRARLMTRTAQGFRFGTEITVIVDESSLPPMDPRCWHAVAECYRAIGGAPTAKTNHVQLADFNGDATSDLIVRVTSLERFPRPAPGCPPVQPRRQREEHSGIQYVTGLDAETERIRRLIPQNCWETHTSDRLHAFTVHSTSGSQLTLKNYADLAPGNPAVITFGDTNADGLTDVFVLPAANSDWYSNINTGKSFVNGVAMGVQDFKQQTRFQDINGDGRADFLYVVNHQNLRKSYNVRYGLPAGGYGTPQNLPGGNNGVICEGGGCNQDLYIPMFSDLDGDGIIDFTSMKFDNSPSMRVSRSNSRFMPRDVIVQVVNGLGAETHLRYAPMTNASIYRRGSGVRDSVNWGRGSPVTDFIPPMYVVERASSTSPQPGAPDALATLYYRYAHARMQAGGRGFLGFSRIETVDPNHGNGHVVTSTSYAQNFPFIGMPTHTVKRVVSDASFNPDACRNGLISDSCFGGAGDHPDLGGSVFSARYQEWEADVDVAGSAMSAFSPGQQLSVHVRTAGTEETSRDPWAGGVTSTVVTAFVYGGYGNVTQTAVDTYTSGTTLLSSVTTNNLYNADDVGKWRLGRLTTATVTHARPGKTPVVRNTRFRYDMGGPATGLLLSEEVQGSDGPGLRTQHWWDVFGNKVMTATCSTSRPDCDPAGLQFHQTGISDVHRYSRTEYDNRGRFPVAGWEPFWSDAGGDEEPVGVVAARDVFGQPTQVEDANGVLTVAVPGSLGGEYFSWQQTAQGQTSPATTGVGSYMTRRWCGTGPGQVSCPAGAVFRTQKWVAGAPTQWTWFDALGRPVMQASQSMNAGVSGKDVSATCTSYDAAGKPVRASIPFFLPGVAGPNGPEGLAGACAIGVRAWVVTSYDLLGRPLAVQSPGPADSETLTSTYHNLITGTRDARGNLTNTFRNGAGEVERVVETTGLATDYEYDAAGNVVRISRNDGRGEVVNEFAYDSLGRKTAQRDPDAGYTEFRYNVLGELIVQTNADLQRIESDYDARGRVWRRTVRTADSAIESQSVFTFDTAANGLGALASETITGAYEGWRGQAGLGLSFTRSHTYDPLGRPQSSTTVIDGVAYPGTVIYDALGRAARVQDATGLWAKTAYDARGFARALCYSSAGDTAPGCATPWLTSEETDAWGNVIREIRSWTGQLPVTRSHNPLTGRLERICADKPGSGTECDLVDEQYAWDKAGNLHTRMKDTRYIERFEYDELNRLTHAFASLGGGADIATHRNQYDRLGNTCARLIGTGTFNFTYNGRAGCGLNGTPGQSGLGDIGAHQARDVRQGRELPNRYHYDNRGNQTVRSSVYSAQTRRIRYSADDRPYEISLGSETAPVQRARFWYGPDGQRYKREDISGKRTLYLGNVEVEIQGTQARMRRMIGGSLLMMLAPGVQDHRFLFHDHLGSVVKATDPFGNALHQLDYMPDGRRRDTGNPQQSVGASPDLTSRGFTGHEHVDGFDVIHMNGRIYDPTLGRFLQPDPVVQAPMGAQGWNAYTYVFNNPLAYTDPSGMISLRQVLGIVIAVVGTYVTAGMDGGFFAKLGMAMAFGAASGYVATGTWRGAVTGAFTAGITFGVGWQIQGWGAYEQMAAHAVTGGVMESLQGGSFGNGFLSAGMTAAVVPNLRGVRNDFVRTTLSAVVGGTLSRATGGKFANGAISGAIQSAMAGWQARRMRSTHLAPGRVQAKTLTNIQLDEMDSEFAQLMPKFRTVKGTLQQVADGFAEIALPFTRKWGFEIGANIIGAGSLHRLADITLGYFGGVTIPENLAAVADVHTHPAGSADGMSGSVGYQNARGGRYQYGGDTQTNYERNIDGFAYRVGGGAWRFNQTAFRAGLRDSMQSGASIDSSWFVERIR